MTDKTAEVIWVSGPVMRSSGGDFLSMYETVEVGAARLIGEVIALDNDVATLQIYEDTGGIRPGDPVAGQGAPLSVEIGPGLLGQIFDGIQRPLGALRKVTGDFIGRGAQVTPLDREKAWPFEPRLKVGDTVAGGDILGVVPETGAMEHRVLAPPGVAGEIVYMVPPGAYTLKEAIARVKDSRGRETELFLWHRWPVRQGRPYRQRLLPTEPLITGQRVLDTLFPLARGGAAAIPGGFGTGKTITQHQLSKWCEADLIVYVGCGERGNEMTGILTELPAPPRPPHRAPAPGAHHSHRQHLQHAGGGPGGFHLHRHHPGRGFSRHGLRRGPDGRLHLPLGRGPAGNLRDDWRRCRRRKAFRPTWPPAWRSSMNGPAR